MSSVLDWLCAGLTRLGVHVCDARHLRQLRVGYATYRDARSRLGEPHATWRESDGGATWEYSRQPQGTRCYMLRFDADGVLRGVNQVLNAITMARVQPGMHDTEVRRLLGAPARTLRYARKGESEWRWRIEDDAAQGVPVFFSVEFDDEMRVRRTGRHVERGGG